MENPHVYEEMNTKGIKETLYNIKVQMVYIK